MHRKAFIDIILNSISDKFDIYHNYWFDGKKFVIYAYCYDYNNKYEVTGNSNKIWEAKSFEHLFFINCDELELDRYESLKSFAIDKIEPHFVRGDGNSPVKNHMNSYISFIIISKNKPSDEVIKAIESTKYCKNYWCALKGFSDMRIACVTPSEKYVITNKSAKRINAFLHSLLENNDEN